MHCLYLSRPLGLGYDRMCLNFAGVKLIASQRGCFVLRALSNFSIIYSYCF